MRENGKGWELYHMVDDRTELHDQSSRESVIVRTLFRRYDRCGVLN